MKFGSLFWWTTLYSVWKWVAPDEWTSANMGEESYGVICTIPVLCKIVPVCVCALQASAIGRSVCRRVSCRTHQYQPVLICRTADLQVPGTFRPWTFSDWPRSLDAVFWTTGRCRPGIGRPWGDSTGSWGPRPPSCLLYTSPSPRD